MVSSEEMLKRARLFVVRQIDYHKAWPRGEEREIYISSRGKSDEDRWAITNHSSGGFNFNRDREWEYEMLPSNRDDDFFKRTRYTLAEAWEICEQEGWIENGEDSSNPR